MARGPKIVATVEAEVRDFVKGMDEAGDASEQMSGRVKRSSEELGTAVEGADGKANAAERGFRGFSDSINGTSDVMGGLASGNLVQVGMGLADLAGSVQDLVLPLFQQMAVKLGLVQAATEGQTVAQEASNVAMAANPIGLVVIALVALAAAFYVAWTKSETFRDIVTGTFDAVKVAFEATITFFEEHWTQMLAVLTLGMSQFVIEIVRHWGDIQAAVSKVFGVIESVAGPIIDGIHAGIDGISGAIGWLITQVEKAAAAIRGLPGVGAITGIAGGIGGTIGRFFAEGGVVPGNESQAVPIVAHGGELVLNAAQQNRLAYALGGGGGTSITYYPAGYNRRELNDSQRRWQRINGGTDRP